MPTTSACIRNGLQYDCMPPAQRQPCRIAETQPNADVAEYSKINGCNSLAITRPTVLQCCIDLQYSALLLLPLTHPLPRPHDG